MAYFGPWPDAFTHAEAFLAKGKSKTDRPVQSNTRLRRVDADTIALVLHHTAVVTFHRDGTFTIYGGGWNTVTTKARIREHSPISVGSNGHGSWVVGYSDELTPPRVQKCRTCHGKGGETVKVTCDVPWHKRGQYGIMTAGHCAGPQTVYPVPIGEPGWYEARRVEPCPHFVVDGTRHREEPCEHGSLITHQTGTRWVECHRCHGEGRADYGSNPVPIIATASQPFKVDASGAFLGFVDDIPSAGGGNGYASHGYPKSFHVDPPVSSAPHLGGRVADQLAAVIPGLDAMTTHPLDILHQATVRDIIVSLNDRYGWSRERVADWLDTLDVDLTFPAA